MTWSGIPRVWVNGVFANATMMNEISDALAAVAAADHVLLFTPVANNDTPGAGTATWFTLGNVTVPSWATTCQVVYSIVGVFNGAIGTNASHVVKIGTVSGAVSKRVIDPGVINQRFPITVADQVAGLTPGVQSVTVASTYTGGGGFYRIDTFSYVSAAFTFLP